MATSRRVSKRRRSKASRRGSRERAASALKRGPCPVPDQFPEAAETPKVWPNFSRDEIWTGHVVDARSGRTRRKSDSEYHLKTAGSTAVAGGFNPDGTRQIVDHLADIDARYSAVRFRETPAPAGEPDPGQSPVFNRPDPAVTVYGDSGVRTRVRTLESGAEVELPIRQRPVSDGWD